MLSLKVRNTTPPDLFYYKFPQDGRVIDAYDHGVWMEKAQKYAKDNGYPIPTQEEMEDQLCRRLNGEWCASDNPNVFIKTRFKMDELLRSAKVVLTGTIVSQDVAEERARICSMCFANINTPWCFGCAGIADFVAKVKGAKKTKFDHLLKVCGVCLCSNEAQVWYSDDDLRQTLTPETMATYQTIDHCWKRKLFDSV